MSEFEDEELCSKVLSRPSLNPCRDYPYETPSSSFLPSSQSQSPPPHGHDRAHYKFAYGVHDPHTHDKKSQYEHRKGHHVTGEYELKEPDGTHRVVKYIAGPHSGFEAIVERRGHAQHPDHKGHHYGATSYVEVTHWGDQGDEDHHH
ncbi:hypothetical protein NQ318_012384 [Aromia moschata]|uniref:Uncharacterized protein n=1 Tax=Aromia moschata TaxID=1265417 RepID=A0AAV8Y473_9CUCU|nr:hypothetical protein NQ318_012384 [Aromia moschata]